MAAVDENLIRSVVEQIVAQLAGSANSLTPTMPTGANSSATTGCQGLQQVINPGYVQSNHSGMHTFGVHATADQAVQAAADAFQKFKAFTLEQRLQAISCIRDLCLQNAERWGRDEFAETKIGRLDHKIEKLLVAGKQTPGVEFLRAMLYSGDNGFSLENFSPFGVVAAVTPVTHSLPTLASNAISMLAAGNTVVFNAHPSGAAIAMAGVRAFNEAIYQQLGIDTLLNIIHPPTIESAQALFQHKQVNLIVVTGGPAVARAALATSKRAIVAGPGNPPVIVDRSADLYKSAKSIIEGCAYDNNLLCIGEKEVFVEHSIFNELMSALRHVGGFQLNDAQFRELEAAVFLPGNEPGAGKVLNKQFVGKSPVELAAAIRVQVPETTQILFGETSEHSPFVDHEQMMPVLPIVRTADTASSVQAAVKAEHGYRHTAIAHAQNLNILTQACRELDVTIFVCNGSSINGLGLGGEGYISFSVATPTGEGIITPLTLMRKKRVTLKDTVFG